MSATSVRPAMYRYSRTYSSRSTDRIRRGLSLDTGTGDENVIDDGEREGNSNERTPLIGKKGKRTATDLKQKKHNLSRRMLEKTTPGHPVFVRIINRIGYATWEILLCNYANVLLVFVPLGIIAGVFNWSPIAIFTLNFFAIIPLAALLAFVTEELAAKLGQTIGGLLNATFGNAVELIVSIIALKGNQIRIVQASMLGSILSNMLLVLGCCFVAGGVMKLENSFDVTVAQTMSSLMAVASASLIIPAALFAAMQNQGEDPKKRQEKILFLSRGVSFILLILYVLYLLFQLKTHRQLFDEESAKTFEDTSTQTPTDDSPDGDTNEPPNGQASGSGRPHLSIEPPTPDNANASQTIDGDAANQTNDTDNTNKNDKPADADIVEGDTLGPITSGVLLVIITVLVSFCADYLVNAINPIVETSHISRTFIGLILIPIVGNAAEHVTAVVVSVKDKMNLALGVAIGSSMQIAVFVTPFLVLLGWAMDREMTLHFESFETICFFLSVLVVNYLIQDGKSNYLEGSLCLGMYAIIALAFWVYPDDQNPASSVLKYFLGGGGAEPQGQ